jgi:L-threonylcarbamoyladenylate synthase
VTWVIPAQTWVPAYLKGEHNSLAVRVSAHPSSCPVSSQKLLLSLLRLTLKNSSTKRVPKISIRSAHPLVQQLCSTYGGAIVSTSANISNQAPAHSSLAVRQNLNTENIFILPGTTPKHAQPTAIYNALDGSCLRVS